MSDLQLCSTPFVAGSRNRNVCLTFLYKLSNGIARGVWSHASMVSYIYLLENNSVQVLSA